MQLQQKQNQLLEGFKFCCIGWIYYGSLDGYYYISEKINKRKREKLLSLICLSTTFPFFHGKEENFEW